jgi:YidC/Oxa1 family membrane protein insertase
MLIDANIFQPLISVFQSVITFFHNDVGIAWGWSIIALTICVRLVMMPLTVKQFHSMRRLQAHQPQMKALQQKYKDDKQRQQQELMKFYQENGINPLASCLPLVAQLPVFISLFYMLRKNLRTDICPGVQQAFQGWYMNAKHVSHQVALGQTTYCTDPHYAKHYHGGAGFLFIHDITNQAHGIILIVLCLIYVGTQMASTLLMSAPTMDKTQRRMMAFIPIVFVLFIIRFPAGLLIYWITTNTWTMVQQYSLKKIIGAPMVPEVIDATEGGGSTRGGGRASTNGSNAKAGADTKDSGRKGLASMFTPRANKPEAAPETNGNGAGDSSSNGKAGASSKAGSRATPPPPPRKRKKRSGRKR